MRPVVMIGSFPPPVGGAAMVNALVHDALTGAGAQVTRVDVAGPGLAHSRGLAYHVRRIGRNLAALRTAHRAARADATLYIVPDAGLGAWYTLTHVAALGGRFARVVIHHHSCRYVEERSRPIAAITQRTRDKATHVFLTPGMAEAFQRRYGPVACRIATNARFVAEEARRPPAERSANRLLLGHLSNLCADKGFFAVADAFDAVRTAGIDAALILAGPVLEDAVGERLAALRQRHGDRIDHRGSLSGEAKRDFYRGIDLFLFPTRFRQEAAPLVVYEALAAGVPVLATDRGVIAEIVPDGSGAVCARDADFAGFALDAIGRWRWDGPAIRARAERIKAEAARAAERSLGEYDRLAALLVDGPVDGLRVAST